MISVNRLRRRKSDFAVKDWVMDSGAFTELFRFGHYRHSVQEYAQCIKRWRTCGNLLAAVAQDMMCEQVILERTGLTIADHQRLTIERYDELLGYDTGVVYSPGPARIPPRGVCRPYTPVRRQIDQWNVGWCRFCL
jgi:hypothetical protein